MHKEDIYNMKTIYEMLIRICSIIANYYSITNYFLLIFKLFSFLFIFVLSIECKTPNSTVKILNLFNFITKLGSFTFLSKSIYNSFKSIIVKNI